MSTSDNNSHKEEKTDPSAMKKQSEKENEEEERESGNSGPEQLEDLLRNLKIETKMSTSDNNSHKEEKTDPSAMKKQSEKENEEEERESGNSGPEQLEDLLRNLKIETKMSTSDNNSHKEEKTDPSAMKKQSEKENEEEERESGNSGPEQLEDLLRNLKIEDSTVPSDREDIRVKFLINVPMGVTHEMSTNAESHCQKFLDLLKRTAFKEEDTFHFKDIAVVFGLNGKESDRDAVKTELQKKIDSDVAFKKFGFTWPESTDIPYRLIREQIKNHKHTKQFVEQFRTKDPNDPIYFCFFDADTVDFNHVLSSYIDVIKEHNYPTVMSTGYVFPEYSHLRKESERDRQVRIITAKHFPLGTYYPEPNFCVHLPDKWDTLRESFKSTKDDANNMESPNLIREVKQRTNFSAVFSDKNPIITSVPKKTALQKKNRIQFHTHSRTWAMSAYTHGELNITRTCRDEYIADRINAFGIYYFALGKLGCLLNSEMAQRIENRRYFEGTGANQLYKAAKAVRDYLGKANPEA